MQLWRDRCDGWGVEQLQLRPVRVRQRLLGRRVRVSRRLHPQYGRRLPGNSNHLLAGQLSHRLGLRRRWLLFTEHVPRLRPGLVVRLLLPYGERRLRRRFRLQRGRGVLRVQRGIRALVVLGRRVHRQLTTGSSHVVGRTASRVASGAKPEGRDVTPDHPSRAPNRARGAHDRAPAALEGDREAQARALANRLFLGDGKDGQLLNKVRRPLRRRLDRRRGLRRATRRSLGWASPVFVDIRASASKRLESPWRNGREESLRTSSRPTR